MLVKARATYDFPAMDTVDKFPAPLLYIGWDNHKMYCSPLCVPIPPNTRFGDFVKLMLPGFFGAHPDFAKIDWDNVQWYSSGQPFDPDMDKTMAENGLGHKSAVRLSTPGLMGLKGSGF
jgi:phenol hydroxylase P4 protein